ncbi:MAG: L-seryl-tRNA(Sec) selenium transferase, partial [Gemmatimonadota bacterium]|nr:L-seryl-tRNA(Sec) selenium transferase [Gemmatimonadota bacterium]
RRAARLEPGAAAVGGGACPAERLPTTLVTLSPGSDGPNHLALRLRLGNPPVIARILDDRVALDPRTLAIEEIELLLRALQAALQE